MNNGFSYQAGELYDNFDYQAYWKKRGYEDFSERIALKRLIDKINCKSKKNLIDIGAGFGRLAEVYGKIFEHSTLVDPSSASLKMAKKKIGNKKFSFVKSVGSDLPFEKESFGVAIMIRVIHHLGQPKRVIKEIHRILKPEGWFILEFANKRHFKAKLFFSSSPSLEPLDISKDKSEPPFKNYHPLWIENLLKDVGFELKAKLSVSNFRDPILKKLLAHSLLLSMEKKVQKPFGKLNFGPSIFILAKKAPT